MSCVIPVCTHTFDRKNYKTHHLESTSTIYALYWATNLLQICVMNYSSVLVLCMLILKHNGYINTKKQKPPIRFYI